MDDQVFARTKKGRLKLTKEVVEKLVAFQQHQENSAEAGGILLGRWIRGTNDVVVDDVSTPGPDDRRSRHGFFRGRQHHQAAVDDAWHASGGAVSWLGEWHSHPEPHPRPSMVDMLGWSARLRRDSAYGEALFFVIVGTCEIVIWEWHRGSDMPNRLISTSMQERTKR